MTKIIAKIIGRFKGAQSIPEDKVDAVEAFDKAINEKFEIMIKRFSRESKLPLDKDSNGEYISSATFYMWIGYSLAYTEKDIEK